MRSLVVLASAAAWLAGCVQTDLGHLPLFCHQREPRCPKGYICRNHVTLGEACFKDGAELPNLFVLVLNEAGADLDDAAVHEIGPEAGLDMGSDGPLTNGSRTDAPLLDGPGPDAPLLDGPLLDARIHDGPALDAPLTDGPAQDAPRHDGPESDQAAQVDQIVADLVPAIDAG